MLPCSRKVCRLLVGIYIYSGKSQKDEREDSTDHFLHYCPALSGMRQKFFEEDFECAEQVTPYYLIPSSIYSRGDGKLYRVNGLWTVCVPLGKHNNSHGKYT